MFLTRDERRRRSGWPLAMHVIALPDAGLLVHSPTWTGDDTFARIEALGTPRLLFAPNHFHHLSLARFRERWPQALAVASATAIPRLRARGHEGLRPLETLETLPGGVRWLVPEGTKSGEAWIALETESGRTWVVCDAFFHETRPIRGLEGVALRLTKATPGLCIGRTFTGLCLADRSRYLGWVLEAVRRERPTRVVFSHGEPLEGEDTAAKLEEVLQARLR